MSKFTLAAARAAKKTMPARSMRNLLICMLALLPALLFSGHAFAVDAPGNIRVEQNMLLWDDVDGASKYNIYFFNSSATGANGDFVTTVADGTEFELSMAGFYTVVTITPSGEYSALDAVSRVEYNGDGNEPFDPFGPSAPSEIRTQRCDNVVAGSSCTAKCVRQNNHAATGGACRANTGTVIHHRALQSGFECIAQNDTSFVEADVYCRRP